MVNQVTKRDGRVVEYSPESILKAVEAAASAVGKPGTVIAESVVSGINSKLENCEESYKPSVETIQDMVEKELVALNQVEIAKEYILYRAERARVREMNSELMKEYEDITFTHANAADNKRENANIDGDTAMGTMLKYGSEGAKAFNHLYILDKEFSEAHKNGEIHIHDLDFLTQTLTCCQINLTKLFKDGFSTGHGHIREPNSIKTYSALACIAIQSNQNDQHGGQSIPAFDFYMAPGVAKTFVTELCEVIETLIAPTNTDEIKKELRGYISNRSAILNTEGKEFVYSLLRTSLKLRNNSIDRIWNRALEKTEKETYQAMEALVHNLNSMHSRAGSQVPFSSLNYGTDTSIEGRMVIKNLLLATESGLGRGETPIFPIQIFKVKSGVSFEKEDPNYDLFRLACRVSSKRLYPNFSFLDAPYNLKYYKPNKPETEIAYMGCRTRVMANAYDPTREIVEGRGNLSFTSIDLPLIALESRDSTGAVSLPAFYELLDARLEMVVRQLKARLKIQSERLVKNFPFLMGQGNWIDSEKLKVGDKVEEVIKHGTLSIGFIGLAETLVAITGKHHGESQEAQQLGLEIIKRMREFCDVQAQADKLNFSLLATPAEGLSGRFLRIDRKKFGVIPGVTDKEFYTNSFHVPVEFEISAYKKLDIEAPYHELTNAGHISYIELDGDPSKNVDAFESIIRHMARVGIGYGAINHPIDRDPVCGYNGIIDDVCPGCGRPADGTIERIRRITGYLVGTLERFNDAKRSEVEHRVKHRVIKSEQ